MSARFRSCLQNRWFVHEDTSDTRYSLSTRTFASGCNGVKPRATICQRARQLRLNWGNFLLFRENNRGESMRPGFAWFPAPRATLESPIYQFLFPLSFRISACVAFVLFFLLEIIFKECRHRNDVSLFDYLICLCARVSRAETMFNICLLY